jgi:hypothetical protein
MNPSTTNIIRTGQRRYQHQLACYHAHCDRWALQDFAARLKPDKASAAC